MPQLFLTAATWMLAATGAVEPGGAIGCPPHAPANVKLAAKEVRRFVYLRTGSLLPIVESGGRITLKLDTTLDAQQYRLHSVGPALTISGGSDVGVLYGAYRYAEKLGVRFYLHGDVVPDEPLKQLPQVNESGKPLFALRGLNPWGSHPFGFDAWNTDDYKAVFTQLARMRMNFLGVHCYPEGHPYAEPTVWLGTRGDFDAQGRVTLSYPARYYNTLARTHWSILPRKTSDYSFGGGLLFDDDAWAPDVMRGYCPAPATPAACNDVFNRAAAQFHDAFGFARKLGVKTCIGTETPLIMPKLLRQQLQQQGRNPNDPAVVREVYEAMFRRIAASHPLDFYWLWTPEGWTWTGNNPVEYTRTIADVRLAIQALKDAGAPFRLATSGWVLGPQHDRAAFDKDLPKNVPMSAISRQLGWQQVDPAYGRIEGREKWAIPWLESDGRHGLAAPQLFVGRVRRDAADALANGCTGLMGLQWRTDILAPNVAALAAAAWDQSGWNPSSKTLPAKTPRNLACDDFYADWSRAHFGSAAASDIASIFAAVDGRLPISVADGCPSGALKPDPTSWNKIEPNYAFITRLEALRPRVEGAGNRERFDWWLNTLRYQRSLHRVRCALGEFNALLSAKQVESALAKYKELLAQYGATYRLLLETVNSPGGLATVVNLENNHAFRPFIVDEPARRLTAALGHPLPEDARPSKNFAGRPRIIVPTVRNVLAAGETLTLKIIVLDNQPAKSVVVRVRPLGGKAWADVAASHVARGVYSASHPAAMDDFEYHIVCRTSGGARLFWPATAPDLNQTVVIREEDR